MSERMKLVIDGVIYRLQAKGGISRLYNEMLPRLCDLDERLRVLLLAERDIAQRLPTHSRISPKATPQVEQYLRPWRLWKPVIPAARALANKLQLGPTHNAIWHSTYYTLPPKGWSGPVVAMVVDLIHERFANLFNGPEYDRFREQKRRCVLAADAVICISEATRQDLQHFYGLETQTIHTIHLAPGDAFRPLEGHELESAPSLRQPFLLYLGLRAHYKNFETLIRAYSAWPQRQEVSLVVVGPAWTAAEEARLAALGIQERVSLLSGVDDHTLRQLYHQAAAFVYPSLYEGFGIPLLEAMACGCPVIASRIPSTVEVAGEIPFYFEPTQVESLLAAFETALAEGRKTERIQAGLQQAQLFSWDKTSCQVLEVYHALS